MSMLAERDRRKQKWAVDPRNTAWSNDDSKFGQRMLEKMGWSKGFRATINNEDNWIAHQDDFNQLLAQLNTCHGQETTDSPDNKEKKSFSLEEKSKVSKNRVHYMKFTKGKDLSSRSQTDLDCIFGKRQKTPEDHPSPSATEETDTSRTTTSAFTIHEYFARRMAERKSKAQGVAAVPEALETPVERKGRKKRKKEAKDKNADNDIQPKAKKKRNQVECELGDPRWDENPGASAGAGEGRMGPLDEQDSPPKPKKRREKEKGPEQVEAAVGSTLDETPVKRKKKKKGSK
ncbi:hypothetical protein FD754_000184 [Muntiacus muntjak]|uniref:G-patch domain-containing protein n=1 Tax=Muntiacus muntjak TaxID=9888 RepID=A0A5N3W4M9_MUNMU|nr:hypothetical protein FD754_000184 [Muntiacus muntjak]